MRIATGISRSWARPSQLNPWVATCAASSRNVSATYPARIVTHHTGTATSSGASDRRPIMPARRQWRPSSTHARASTTGITANAV